MRAAATALVAAGMLALLVPNAASPTGADDDREPCSDVEVTATRVSGGCVLLAAAAPVTFSVLSIFGDHALARCRVSFELHIGGDGAVAVTAVRTRDLKRFLGDEIGPSQACGDVLPCRTRNAGEDPRAGRYPWKGQLERRDGRLSATVDSCFETCVGTFEGTTFFELEREPGSRWRMSARRATLGDSGFELDGGWWLTADDERLELATGGAKGATR